MRFKCVGTIVSLFLAEDNKRAMFCFHCPPPPPPPIHPTPRLAIAYPPNPCESQNNQPVSNISKSMESVKKRTIH